MDTTREEFRLTQTCQETADALRALVAQLDAAADVSTQVDALRVVRSFCVVTDPTLRGTLMDCQARRDSVSSPCVVGG